MLSNNKKLTARQQAVKDIAEECKQQRLQGKQAKLFINYEHWYSAVFRALQKQNPDQLVIDFS